MGQVSVIFVVKFCQTSINFEFIKNLFTKARGRMNAANVRQPFILHMSSRNIDKMLLIVLMPLIYLFQIPKKGWVGQNNGSRESSLSALRILFAKKNTASRNIR